MSSRSLRRCLLAAGAVPLLALAVSGPSFGTSSQPAPAVDRGSLTATALTPTGTIRGGKASSSTLAETPQALLKRTDATPVNVMIKYDYDATASYTGGVDRLAATSPRATGHKLTGTSTAEKAYTNHIAGEERAISAGVRAAAPTSRIGRGFRTVYGGVQATVPANKVKDIVKVNGVVAVQPDTLNQPLTDASSDFINATSVQQTLGGASTAGKGLIYGNIDYGVWPEHPSFADQGNLAAPPGPKRVCDFGDNPLTPKVDPFVCQHKLIGGRAFLQTYLSDPALAAAEPFHTARDSEGHGTHTASTTAGNVLKSAKLLGVDRGPVRGIAPGAWVMEYKVCGMQGCYASDAAAAVEQAIVDRVDIINYSISGGTDPYTDPVEIAFLDAYAANVFVATSAGNDGPSAGTANHLSPWVTTVAASTQSRQFASLLTLRASNGDTFRAVGDSLTKGAGPLPIVLSSAAPYSSPLCDKVARAGTFAGKIVACERGGNSRIQKGLNVKAGGAAGMVLYNPTLADTEAESHWLPTVHLADGTKLLAFVRSHRGVIATFSTGVKKRGRGDVMAPFSSRGPGGVVIKPDITAPGVLILAGQTPVAHGPDQGPPGEYFQAIAGTSMASPHVAGAALLVRAAHPSWTPGQIKSALMTSSVTAVLKEDAKTPADAFDLGAGRVDVRAATGVTLTLDETAHNFFAKGRSARTAVDLNIPSVDATTMPGALTTTRTVTNVSTRSQQFTVSTTIQRDSRIRVSPSRFTLRPGHSQRLTVTLSSRSPLGSQRFGMIAIAPTHRGGVAQHLPVAFVHTQGDVTLTQTCTPAAVKRLGVATCRVEATNHSPAPQTVSLRTRAKGPLAMGADGATLHGSHGPSATATLAGSKPGIPSVAPGASPAGYVPLARYGVPATPIGDEQMLTYPVPAFRYNGRSYTSVGVNSNGYVVAGGVTAADTVCCDLPGGPSAAAPNSVLAPFWTDLDGTGAPGVFVSVMTSGSQRWLVVEHQVFVAGTRSPRVFQTWIGLNGTQDISFAYDPARLPTAPAGASFLVGAENELGQGAMRAVAPTTDLVVTSTDPTPADSFSYSLDVRGIAPGTGTVTTEMRSPTLPGTTIVTSKVEVIPG